MTSMKRLHALFRGRVQGVNFRRHVGNLASDRGLCGRVRNLTDGTVEMIVEGDEGSLQALVGDLKSSPPPIRVDEVQESWSDAEGGIVGFKIVR